MAVPLVSGEADSITCAILTISRAELQQLNFDRIFPELEEKGVLPKGFTNIMKSKTASQKSNVLKNVLQAKDDKEFLTFLEAVAAEDDENFFEPTKEFMAMVSNFSKYEDYCHSLKLLHPPSEESETIHYSFVQIGNDSGVFTVGRDGKTHHDSVHGITLYIPSDSLPCGIEQITVSIKVGFSYHNLSPGMVMCSATVALQCVPAVIFTKDVFLEIPHSASSADSSDLCFVKFKDDVCETGYGEVYNGIFPVDYPYGVITMRSFSSYVIVKGKRYLNQSSLRRTRLQWSKRKWVHALNKSRKIVSHISSYSDGQLCKPSSSSFWLCVSRISGISNEIKFLCVVSQCTPTGFEAMKQHYSGHTWEYYTSFSFDSDWLVFHPQSAQDCGWSAKLDGYYKINKSEAERLCSSDGKLSFPLIKYTLTPDQHLELYVPRVTVNATGADERLSFDLTLKSPGTESTFKYNVLQCLSTRQVAEDKFLQQLAFQLPVWQPVAQMLGLTDSDIEHIEHDVSASRGERAYKAFLQWMQKEGHHGAATYDVLLQALCKAKELRDCNSITSAWWFAHQHLSNIADQPIDIPI